MLLRWQVFVTYLPSDRPFAGVQSPRLEPCASTDSTYDLRACHRDAECSRGRHQAALKSRNANTSMLIQKGGPKRCGNQR